MELDLTVGGGGQYEVCKQMSAGMLKWLILPYNISEMISVDNLHHGIDDAKHVRLSEMIFVDDLHHGIDDAKHIRLSLYRPSQSARGLLLANFIRNYNVVGSTDTANRRGSA